MTYNKVIAIYVTMIMVLSASMVMYPMGSDGADGDFGGGSGTVGDPYVIEDVWDLQNMAKNVSAHYVLAKDINASETKSWNSGEGFMPVATWKDPFIGSLDGRNHTITGLFINRPAMDHVGLFGYLGSKPIVKNLGLVDNHIVGKERVGGFVGNNLYGTLNNCYLTGDVSGNMWVGGIAGWSQWEIIGCYNTGSVSGDEQVGGLAGYNQGILKNCYSTGSVDGVKYVGGLSGAGSGIVSNSHYNVDEVLINGGNHLTIGGLFDDQYEDWFSNGMSLDISDYSSSLVPSGIYYDIGDPQGIKDLLGFSDIKELSFRLSSDIDLSDDPGLFVPFFRGGEFHGDNRTISGLSVDLDFVTMLGMFGLVVQADIHYLVMDDVELSGTGSVGGVVGYMFWGEIAHCHSSGLIRSQGSAGGIVGSCNTVTITDCYANCDVVSTGSYVGGIVGSKYWGEMTNCHASGNVEGGYWRVGGLIGTSTGSEVTNCSATGNVRGTDDYVGGLMGMNEWGRVSGCYATGTVSGDRWGIGGLIGVNDGGIASDCYATGKVIGIDNAVGGLIGDNTGAVYNCYSTGNVSGTGTYFGGLVGYQFGTVSDCFWDVESSGRTSSYGGTGKTTAEMKTESTFTDAGWYFNVTWHIVEDTTYPFLRWQDAGAPVANAGPEQIVYLGPEGDAEVFFDGSGSTDDIGVFNYTWTFVHQGSDVVLYGEMTDFVFRTHGLYDVTLKATDASGNWDVDIMQVAVLDHIAPTADAGPDQVVNEGTLVTFDGSESSDNVLIIGYEWSFTDGVPVSLRGVDPSYDFNNPGVFVVTLTVTDSSGNIDTDNMTVEVIDITPPIANAGPDQTVEEGTVVIFNGSASLDNVGIVNWTWTLRDGVTLYGVGPSYLFEDPGVYDVTLNVTDGVGHWHTDSMTVTVLDITPPVADAGPDIMVDEGDTVIFNGSGSTDNVGIANWTWMFDDNGMVMLNGVSPSYKFNTPGIFIVTLNVTDGSGNWHTDNIEVTVRDITDPVANAGEDLTVAVGALVSFDGSLSTDNGVIKGYLWTFTYDGDEIALEGDKVSFTFNKGGVYSVLLTVKDEFDNVGEDTVIVTVVDTATVNGVVLDGDGKPISGATVEITASNGEIYTTTTGPDGSFSLEIFHGPFAWRISKDGYRTISGTGSADPAGEVGIDLSGHPLEKEKEKERVGPLSAALCFILLLVAVIVILIGVVLFFLLRKKGAQASDDWDEE